MTSPQAANRIEKDYKYPLTERREPLKYIVLATGNLVGIYGTSSSVNNLNFTMSKETRRDVLLVFIIFLLSAAGMTSVFVGCRILAWIVIVISDLYLSIVLVLAALRSDDDGFLKKHSWMAGFFPRRRTTGLSVVILLFVAVVCGFAGLYVGTEVFSSVKTPLDALYISSFTLAFTDYSPKPGYGQLVVLGQLVSGVLLLVALFPLVISRISTFKNR